MLQIIDEKQRLIDINTMTSVEYNKKYKYILKLSQLREDIKIINKNGQVV